MSKFKELFNEVMNIDEAKDIKITVKSSEIVNIKQVLDALDMTYKEEDDKLFVENIIITIK